MNKFSSKKLPILLLFLFGSILVQTPFAEEYESDKSRRMKFGFKVAPSFYFMLGEYNNPDFTGLGYGFGAGFIMGIPINDFISINPEFNNIIKILVTIYEHKYNDYWSDTEEELMFENVLSFVMPVRIMPSKGKFFLETGVQLDIPSEINADESISGYRSSSDFGFVFGLGWQFRIFSFGIRNTFYLTNYSSKYNGSFTPTEFNFGFLF